MYERQAEGLIPRGELSIVTTSDCAALFSEEQWITGPAAAQLEATRCASAELREARPQDLLNVALSAPWAVTTDMWIAEPYYLRGSSAEEKAAAK
jgi:hypothetical protein